HAGKAKKQDPAPAVIGTIWPMEPFIINIQDSGSDRYLKLVVQLEIADAQGVKDLDLLKPKLRDNILELLGAKTYRELMDTAGKQRLREEIAMRLNSFLTTTKVTRVYFTEFVIQ
ncbi:MAG TPA: flagellar basal body-associated FliL family protein, partial [Syntrophales bacterium]|nr:flagellar basal body-associated FliL family protein [Syntrophales bacterium]